MRPKNATPSYLKHKATGRGRVVIDGKTYYLPGKYKSPESVAEYHRLCAEWSANHATILPNPSSSRQYTGVDFRGNTTNQCGLFVSELIVGYTRHADQYYVKDGERTSEVSIIDAAMRPVRKLYGHTLAKDFGPIALESCRNALLVQHTQPPDEKGRVPRQLSRNTINKMVAAIRLMFRWAASKEMIPGSVPGELATLPGLRKGRSTARETAKVRPARDEFVEKSLEFMPRQVAAMVQLQLLTGMRPGEVVIIRTCDLNTTGKIWEYNPSSFKTEHHELERGRTVYIGPRAQEILRPWLKADLEAFLFSPAEAFAELQAERREARQTPVYASHAARYQREKKARGRALGSRPLRRHELPPGD